MRFWILNSACGLILLIILVYSVHAESANHDGSEQQSAREQDWPKSLLEDLQHQTSESREKLLRAMSRYQDWRAHLSESDRASIDQAPDANTRIKRIRELLLQHWIDSLPVALRAKIDKAVGDDKVKLIAEIRQEESKREARWREHHARSDFRARSNRWRRQELPGWLRRVLLPKLSEEEKTQLRRAQRRQGNRYLSLIVQFSRKYEVALPEDFGRVRPRRPPGRRRIPMKQRKRL